MGQSFSKAAGAFLSRASRTHEKTLLKEAIEEADARRAAAAAGKYGGFTDPNASLGGFRREKGKEFEVERRQEEFLRSEMKKYGRDGKETELNEDLLKFLKEVGPLERRIEKNLTSPRVFDALERVEKERRRATEEARMRRRRRMPLAEALEGNEGGKRNEDQLAISVERTTNFSSAAAEEEDPTVLRLKDVDLLKMLRSGAGAFSLAEKPVAEDAAESFLRELESKYTPGVSAASAVRKDNLRLLTGALQYTGVPVLMKDMESADYIGVWEHKVDELRAMKLEPVLDEVILGLDGIKERYEQQEESMDEVAAVTSMVDKEPAMLTSSDALRKNERKKKAAAAAPTFRSDETSVAMEEPKDEDLSEHRGEGKPKESGAAGTAAFLEQERRRQRQHAEEGDNR